MHFFKVIGVVVVLNLLLSCGFRRNGDLALPPTAILDECEQFAVVSATHALHYRSPSVVSDVLHISRKGDIVPIADKSAAPELSYGVNDYWYRVRARTVDGWVFGAFLFTYCYEYQATLAQQLLLE